MQDFVRIDRADVYKAGVHAGHLASLGSHVEFSYTAEYVAQQGPAVAFTLPTSSTALQTPARSVPQFFAGLLPEGRRLTALRTALKTSADDDFSMLLAVGADPIGDVQIVVSGEKRPLFGANREEPKPFDEQSFTELFSRAIGIDPDRGGIAGAQDKVSGQMLSLPVNMRNGAFILKLDPVEFPHLVANEAFFLAMANDCGIPTTKWQLIHDRDGRDGLLVERFDRVQLNGGQLGALPCEDACQVLNRYPGDKYALDTETLLGGLASYCPARPVALRDMLRQLVFAIITGNGDLHAKNFSLLRSRGEWKLSPAYDLPSSYVYGDSTLGLAIAQSRQLQVSRKMLLTMATTLGLPERAVTMTIDDLVERTEPWLDRVAELPFDMRRLHDLRRLMTTRLNLLRGSSR
jgi:serine/threonine-protein kinase HipA